MMDEPEAMIQGGDAAQGYSQPTQPQMHLDAFKPSVNNLIWMYGPPTLTLQEAEERACAIINLIMDPPAQGKFDG